MSARMRSGFAPREYWISVISHKISHTAFIMCCISTAVRARDIFFDLLPFSWVEIMLWDVVVQSVTIVSTGSSVLSLGLYWIRIMCGMTEVAYADDEVILFSSVHDTFGSIISLIKIFVENKVLSKIPAYEVRVKALQKSVGLTLRDPKKRMQKAKSTYKALNTCVKYIFLQSYINIGRSAWFVNIFQFQCALNIVSRSVETLSGPRNIISEISSSDASHPQKCNNVFNIAAGMIMYTFLAGLSTLGLLVDPFCCRAQ